MTQLAPSELDKHSVVGEPQSPLTAGLASVDSYFLLGALSKAADGITRWGYRPRQRDFELRQFWPTEPTLAGVVYSTVARYAAFQWTLTGPPRMTDRMQNMLQSCEHGQGWAVMMSKFLTDVFTQDNGGFLEIVRAENRPDSPTISLNHLDAASCERTGVADTPVIYNDRDSNKQYLLPWYSVIPFAEMPSPIKTARGMQVCAVSRILIFAQIMKNIETIKAEKSGGSFVRRLHLVGGVQTRAIEDAIGKALANSEAQGFTKYVTNAVLGSLDPNAKVSHETIDFAELPDNWDEATAMTWYLTMLANAFGTDYQDYAPMPGGGIGSGNQAKVQAEKSRGKGPRLFMTLLEGVMNFHGVLPRSVRFKMGETSISEEMEKTALAKERALLSQIMIDSGIITTEVARQIAVDNGDLDPRYLQMMHEQDATDEATVRATQPRTPDGPVDQGMAGPKEPPGGTPPAPANSNAMRTKPPSQSQKVVPGGPR